MSFENDFQVTINVTNLVVNHKHEFPVICIYFDSF